MVQLIVVLKVCAVDGELVVRVELAFVSVGGSPRIRTYAFDDVHAMVDGGAVVLAPHLCFRRRRVEVRVSREDDIPVTIDAMQLRCP